MGVDGSLTIEAKPGRLLWLNGNITQLESREGRPLVEPNTLSSVAERGTSSRHGGRRGQRPGEAQSGVSLPPSRSRQHEPWLIQGHPMATPQWLHNSPASLPSPLLGVVRGLVRT